MYDFRFHFNRRRQWVDVYLHDIHPDTFHRNGGGRWAYYIGTPGRARHGGFGELHFVSSRIRPDVVCHELFHVLCDLLRVRKQALSERNEERVAEVFDELTRNFWKEYAKLYPKHGARIRP